VAERTEELEQRAWQLQKLTLELTEAEERERQRLAHILHDDLQQVLAAAKFHISILGNHVKTDPALQKTAAQVNDLLSNAIDKSRHLSHELSAPVLVDNNLSGALEWLARQMQTQHGLTIHLDTREPVEVASEPLRVLLYKAAQELLFNVVKHADVREATLRLRHRHGRLALCISDRGRGFDAARSVRTPGFGLLSIRERIGFLGGHLRIRSAPGKGSTFLLTVPDPEGSA
jgi:two-component system CheB/CheR fusion protein